MNDHSARLSEPPSAVAASTREESEGERLALRTDINGDLAVIVVSGELDPHTAPDLTDAVSRQLERLDGGRLALDLADVAFLDSTGLRAILTSKRLIEDRGLRFVIQNPGPAVVRLLEVTQLTDRLDTEP